VTTTLQWCSSRSSRSTAVVFRVGSGPRIRTASAIRCPGSGVRRRLRRTGTAVDSGVVERGEPELGADDQVVAQQGVENSLRAVLSPLEGEGAIQWPGTPARAALPSSAGHWPFLAHSPETGASARPGAAGESEAHSGPIMLIGEGRS
jgi:hypothetical protein